MYAALTDPEELGAVVPGLERIEAEDASNWTAIVRPPGGAGGFRFRVSFHLTEEHPPEHARLQAWGKAFGARAEIESEFDLAPEGDGTQMRWAADVRLAGLLVGLGADALRPLARRQANAILDGLERRLRER